MLDMNRIPKHIAIIMDGNGRWAKKHKVPRVAGHNAGMKSMKEIVRHASDLGVHDLTVYAFSTENWKRTEEEIGGIFKLIIKYVDLDLDELNAHNVKMQILGDYSPLPKASIEKIEEAVGKTKDNTGMRFNIALNYGGRLEILESAKELAKQYKEGLISLDDFSEENFAKYLTTGDTAGNLGDPDLIIRTSGEERLSNFLLWQAAYSEFVFTDVLWPDFTPEELEKCIEEYQSRDRRYGGR
ncbi:MAG: isoprenyl transferase [Clostridia bacterium]|nr:isoprenyl transferase [Clostridia bacterium]